MNGSKKFFGYKAAVGAFLVMFVNLGACTTLGIFLSSLSEYSGWDLGMVGYIGTVNTIGNVILNDEQLTRRLVALGWDTLEVHDDTGRYGCRWKLIDHVNLNLMLQ